MLPMESMSSMVVPWAGIALAALVGSGCEPAAPGAGLTADEATVDFGRVYEGGLVEHDFTVTARTPTRVTDAKTDCGCTVARLTRADGTPYELGAPVPEGTSLVVRARYDTRGREGAARRAITLTTSQGEFVPLTLVADVRPWLVVEPRGFELARVLEHGTLERDLRVTSSTGERFALHATGRALHPAVTVELTPEDPDDSGRARAWRGRVHLGSDAPEGTHSYPIELESDVLVPGVAESAGETRRYSVAPPFTIQVLGPMALSTPELEFGLVRAGETVARSLRVECFDPEFTPAAPTARLEPFRAGAEFPLERTSGVHVRAVEGRPAFDVEITLAGLDPAVQGTFLARLVVETGHPRRPRLEALVRGTRAPEGRPAPAGARTEPAAPGTGARTENGGAR